MGQTAHLLRWKALFLKRTLGTRSAAGFLRNRGVTIQEAMMILAGTCIVRGGL
jgi:hypothetical protein